MTDLYKNSNVINLIKADFTKKKLNNKNFKGRNGLIVFYAPWCSHCQKMVDNWECLADSFYPKFSLGAVNVEDIDHNNFELLKDFNIRRYPTIKYVTKTGTVVKYKGNRNYNNLLYFIWGKV